MMTMKFRASDISRFRIKGRKVVGSAWVSPCMLPLEAGEMHALPASAAAPAAENPFNSFRRLISFDDISSPLPFYGSA
jgi:hypothetical protein